MAKFGSRLGLTRYEADEHYRQALEAYGRRNLEQAIMHIGQALELLPNNAEYRATRGLFYLQDGLDEQATADFDAALVRHPYELLANYGRGVLAYRSGDYDSAMDFFRTAHAVDGERTETKFYLALLHHHRHDNRRALSMMREVHQALAAREDDRDARRGARHAERWIETLTQLVETFSGFAEGER